MSEWISVKDLMPEDGVEVLVWFEYYRYGSCNLYQIYGIGQLVTEATSHNSIWLINDETRWHRLRVIAWKPLPQPPKDME